MPTPIFETYSPKRDETIDGKIKGLMNAYVDTTQQLKWLLSNLDESNVIRAKSVITDWVYAGNVTTDQLTAGTAKIGTAMIEDLIVGSNVTMGADATISWNKVTDQPTIPSEYTDSQALQAWANSGYSTHINSTGVYTGTLAAQHAVISNGSGTGSVNINLGTSDYVSLRGAYTTSGNTFIVGKATSAGGSISTMERIDMFAGTLYVYNNLYVNTSISIGVNAVATQTWVEGKGYATETWVNGKGYITQTAADDRYVKQTTQGQGVSMQYVESGGVKYIEIFVNGVYMGRVAIS